MTNPNKYADDLRRLRSLLIVTSLQKRRDIKATKKIRAYATDLDWLPHDRLMIETGVWQYAVDSCGYDPKLVFCHPDVLRSHPETSLYYRGLSGLSLKSVRDYFGSVDNLEAGNLRARLKEEKALKMARTYNTFVCSIIKNSTAWTLENGRRTILATLGITLDGQMRNKVGDIAEERIRSVILEYISDNSLMENTDLSKEDVQEITQTDYSLVNDVTMRFGAEPDIAFERGGELLAVLEIKGGIDPAGALERYGAAMKSFQHAVSDSPKCRNFFLSAVFTTQLRKRISADRLVEKSFDIIEILENPAAKEDFVKELFHHVLRLM